MGLTVDTGWLACVMLVSLRLGVLLLMSPIFPGLGSFTAVRVLLGLALSASLVSALGLAPVPVPGLGALLGAALGEIALGVVLAFGVFAGFGAFSVAGKLLDIQSGFGIGSVYDPVTRGGAPVFGSLLNMVAVVGFFATDGHRALLRGFAYSLSALPPGQPWPALPAEPIVAQFGLMFALGCALVIPVIVCLFLVELGLAVVSRVLPQMNVFMVIVPVKIWAALALFALSASTLAPAMHKVYASIFQFWEAVLAHG